MEPDAMEPNAERDAVFGQGHIASFRNVTIFLNGHEHITSLRNLTRFFFQIDVST